MLIPSIINDGDVPASRAAFLHACWNNGLIATNGIVFLRMQITCAGVLCPHVNVSFALQSSNDM